MDSYEKGLHWTHNLIRSDWSNSLNHSLSIDRLQLIFNEVYLSLPLEFFLTPIVQAGAGLQTYAWEWDVRERMYFSPFLWMWIEHSQNIVGIYCMPSLNGMSEIIRNIDDVKSGWSLPLPTNALEVISTISDEYSKGFRWWDWFENEGNKWTVMIISL